MTTFGDIWFVSGLEKDKTNTSHWTEHKARFYRLVSYRCLRYVNIRHQTETYVLEQLYIPIFILGLLLGKLTFGLKHISTFCLISLTLLSVTPINLNTLLSFICICSSVYLLAPLLVLVWVVLTAP